MDGEISKLFLNIGYAFLSFQEEDIHPLLEEGSHKQQL